MKKLGQFYESNKQDLDNIGPQSRYLVLWVIKIQFKNWLDLATSSREVTDKAPSIGPAG